jgi:hypothetical protein
MAGSCEHNNELLGTIKGGEFFIWVTVRFSRLCAPWSLVS